MPPKGKKDGKGKGKGKGKKDKKSKYPIIIEGVVTNEMTREEMESYIVTIRRELEKERIERNYFQLERDKVTGFWELTRLQLDDVRLELRNKDRELEEAEEKHQLELKVYRQKVKHLMYEHENTEAATKEAIVTAVTTTENNFNIEKIDLRNFGIGLKLRMRQKQLESEESNKHLKRNYESELTKLREDFIEKSKELDNIYQDKMKTQRDEMNLRRKSEIHEIEERKNYQIKTLIDNHDDAFRAMKNFYNEITLNNLCIIKTLKENIDSLRKKLLMTEGKLECTSGELRKKSDIILSLEYTLEELKRIKALLENERMGHRIARGHVNRLTQENKEVTFENEVLLTRYTMLEEERESVRSKCEKCLLELQQKTGLGNLLLERKLNELRDELEKKDIQIHQILAAGHLDPEAVRALNTHIENVLSCKNNLVKSLEYELARTQKSNIDLKSSFETYLNDMNQYSENVGLNLIKTQLETRPSLGKGPAGLVSVPL